MVMKYLFYSAGEVAAKVAVARVIERVLGNPDLSKMETEMADAKEESFKRQIEALGRFQDAKNGVSTVVINGTERVKEAEKTCPACDLFDRIVLAKGYASGIGQACGEETQIPKGHGGTIIQVRQHLQAAIGASHRLGEEKPAFAQAGGIMAEGLQGLLSQVQGDGVDCTKVKSVMTMLDDAQKAADAIALAWWKKPITVVDSQQAQEHAG